MAYLILDDSEPGSGSAYFEFNPENEASLSTLEALLRARRTMHISAVEQIGEIATASMEVSCNKQPALDWLPGGLQTLTNILFRKNCTPKGSTCRCGKQRINYGLSHSAAHNKLSLVP